MGQTDCPETSVPNRKSTPHNIPEERRFHFLRANTFWLIGVQTVNQFLDLWVVIQVIKKILCYFIGVLISPQPDQEGNKLQRPNSNLWKPLKKKKKSEICPSNQVSAAAMTSASDKKWRPFNCFFCRVGLRTYQHPRIKLHKLRSKGQRIQRCVTKRNKFIQSFSPLNPFPVVYT